MADEREQELKRLEQALLASEISDDDDLLSDLPIDLLDTRPLSWEESEEVMPNEVIPEESSVDDILSEDVDLSLEDIINETLMETEPSVEIETAEGEFVQDNKKNQKREDRWLIILMAIASFLCMGIIGVLIYWMEAFLK